VVIANQEVEIGRLPSEVSPGKSSRPYMKYNLKTKRTGAVAQMTQALSSNLGSDKSKNKHTKF
jgi:hypothetical protein